MKNFLCLVLVLTFTASSIIGCSSSKQKDTDQAAKTATEKSSKYPAYLNTGANFPIIKSGEKVVISVATVINSTLSGKTEEMWFWKYCEKNMNLKFEVEQILDSQAQERKNIMFASNDLKDLMFNLGISATDLVTYGQTDKMLMDLKPMINEDLAPNILALFKSLPLLQPALTTPDNAIYTFPKVGLLDDPAGFNRLWVNSAWMKQLNLTAPKTLDEFYNLLIALRDKDPSGTGKIIPLGGNNKNMNPGSFVLSAMGFLLSGSQDSSDALTAPAIREGKVEIAAGSPLYKEYLTFMNKLYKEKLLHPDYYTLDNTQAQALIAAKRVGVYGGIAPYIVLPTTADYQNYEALSPVTSQWNSTPIVSAPNPYIAGTIVMNKKAKYPEAAMRFIDFFFSAKGSVYVWGGPPASAKETYDIYEGWAFDSKEISSYPEVASKKYNSEYELILKKISPFSGTLGNRNNVKNDMRVMEGLKSLPAPIYNQANGDDFYRKSITDKVLPYKKSSFPIVYFSKEDSTKISDLSTVIKDYVEKETAKFITGANPITASSLDKYYADLKNLKFDVYQKYYQDAYTAYLKNGGK